MKEPSRGRVRADIAGSHAGIMRTAGFACSRTSWRRAKTTATSTTHNAGRVHIVRAEGGVTSKTRVAGAWLAMSWVLVSPRGAACRRGRGRRSEEHTSELQSREKLVCRLLL